MGNVKIGKACVEHWREGERIAKLDLADLTFECDGDASRIIFPPGSITLATHDELHFDLGGVIERLMEIRDAAQIESAPVPDTTR